MQIGVIADTHSRMRPEALEVLQGSDLILHAGDVGRDAGFARQALAGPVGLWPDARSCPLFSGASARLIG